MKNKVIISDSNNPYHNLALEKLLLDSRLDGNILYLWQNRDTIVIGRNQNPWKECNLEQMNKDDVLLARRPSGGGAVFHDLGNLNFTFLSSIDNHDIPKQMKVIQQAVKSLGVDVELNGRNDLIISENKCKFSGNAFQQTTKNALHHGTILIEIDTEKVDKYLTPSKMKLEAKGIKSVRSRICNLKAMNASINVESMKSALVEAFESLYGSAETASEAAETKNIDMDLLPEYEAKYSSWEWRVGESPKYNASFEKKFLWGEVEFMFYIQNGTIVDVHVFSDALNQEMILSIAPALIGCVFQSKAISLKLSSLGSPETNDLSHWMEGENLELYN